MKNLNQCLLDILTKVGSHCIYKDSSSIRLVELTGIRVAKEELEFSLQPLPAKGLRNDSMETFEIGGLLEVLSIRDDRISASYVNWVLFTDQDLVAHLLAFAATAPDINSLLREMRKVTGKTLRAKQTGLNHSSFFLTDDQLRSINGHFLKKSQDYIACGEDAPTSISVTFEWMFPVGRNVTACFDGENNAVVIEDASAL
jgi:hypothetical protein